MRANLFARRVLIVGSAPNAARIEEAIGSLRRGVFVVAGITPASAAAGLSPQTLRRERVWGVVVTSEARGSVPPAGLLRSKRAGFRIFSDVEFREEQLRRIDLDHLEPDWMLFADGLSCSRLETAARRLGEHRGQPAAADRDAAGDGADRCADPAGDLRARCCTVRSGWGCTGGYSRC